MLILKVLATLNHFCGSQLLGGEQNVRNSLHNETDVALWGLWTDWRGLTSDISEQSRYPQKVPL